jgi:6-phosphogluconolactonase
METAGQDSRKVLIFETAEEVARAAAQRFVELARGAVEAAGRFSVALAGGSTPKRTYQLLASDEFKSQVEWSKVHFFFGDERCVPPDHADSNYRMADEALLARVAVPARNVHRITGEGDAVANARLYEDELQTFFAGEAWPRFNLVLLGMGDDGHTASLFPETPALHEQSAWALAVWVEKFNAYRITLSARAINHAAHIVFLVTGAGKSERLSEVIHGRAPGASSLPAQLIHPEDGTLEWLLDRAAAARLSEPLPVEK